VISENPNLCWYSEYNGVTSTLPMNAAVMIEAVASTVVVLGPIVDLAARTGCSDATGAHVPSAPCSVMRRSFKGEVRRPGPNLAGRGMIPLRAWPPRTK
jgi:hypothetical protein